MLKKYSEAKGKLYFCSPRARPRSRAATGGSKGRSVTRSPPLTRRVVRVVEGARLESVYTRKGIKSSNLLLSARQHTSGIQRLPHNFHEQPNYQEENPYARCREEHFAHYFSTLLKLDNVPGEKFQYTNLGMSLLSYIISRIEGKPFPAIVSERVFMQVGMSQSSYDRNILNNPIVRGIDKDGKFCAHWEAGIYDGALGIISTAKDLMAFALWQLDRSSAACQYQANENLHRMQMSKVCWAAALAPP
jgi:hypothetical protein